VKPAGIGFDLITVVTARLFEDVRLLQQRLSEAKTI